MLRELDLPDGRRGESYSTEIEATGGRGTLQWVVEGALGLRAVPTTTSAETVSLEGIPARAGRHEVRFEVTDDAGQRAVGTATLRVEESRWLTRRWETSDSLGGGWGLALIDTSERPFDSTTLYEPPEPGLPILGARQVVWSGDSSQLATVLSEERSTRGDVVVFDVSTGSPSAPRRVFGRALSGDQRVELYFSSTGGWMHLSVRGALVLDYDVDTRTDALEPVPSPSRDCGELSRLGGSPSWTSDGRYWVALRTLEGSSTEDLCIVDYTGDRPTRRIGPDVPGLDRGQVWPDPTSARFVVERVLGPEARFFLVDPDADWSVTDLGVSLGTDRFWHDVHWAPNGRSLLIEDTAIDVSGGTPVATRIDLGGAAAFRQLLQVRFSRDSSSIALSVSASGVPSPNSMAEWNDGHPSELHPLLDRRAFGFAFSSDSRWLVMSRVFEIEPISGDPYAELWACDVSSGMPDGWSRISFPDRPATGGLAPASTGGANIAYFAASERDGEPERMWSVELGSGGTPTPIDRLGEWESCNETTQTTMRFRGDGARYAYRCMEDVSTRTRTWPLLVGVMSSSGFEAASVEAPTNEVLWPTWPHPTR